MEPLSWGELRSPLGIDWDAGKVGRGDVVLVRGPNGCGKTLFLRALADLDPAQGEVRHAGQLRSAWTGPGWRAVVRYVDGNAPRLPESAGRTWEVLGGQGSLPSGLRTDSDHSSLSSGEAQRLALFAALTAQPAVLLLDEATSALDPDQARAAERAVVDAARAGAAVLWITHDDGMRARLGARELRLA